MDMKKGILSVIFHINALDVRIQIEQGHADSLDLDIGTELLVQVIRGISAQSGLHGWNGKYQRTQYRNKDNGEKDTQQYFTKFFDRAFMFYL